MQCTHTKNTWCAVHMGGEAVPEKQDGPTVIVAANLLGATSRPHMEPHQGRYSQCGAHACMWLGPSPGNFVLGFLFLDLGVPGASWKASWGTSGRRHIAVSWGLRGAFVGHPGSLLEASGGPLGRLLGPLGGFLGCLGAPLARPTPLEAVLGVSVVCLGSSWAVLEVFGKFGVLLGPS